jgi:adenylate kinase
MKQLNLVLLGAPGSGKGTQAKVLSEHCGIKKISLGDILRQEAHKNSQLGQTVKKYMTEGVLVPDEITKEVIESAINKAGFVLDGFPRNLNQAKTLEQILESKGITLDKVLYLDVTEEVAVRRLSGRRICKNCGFLYHVVTMPSKKEGICDKCGLALSVREDDKEATVRRRWQVFMEETHGLIEHYKNQDKLLSVNGSQDKDLVFAQIKKKLPLCSLKS